MSNVRVLPVLFFVLILSLATPRTEAQTFSVLYSFTGGSDGGVPIGKLVRDTAGTTKTQTVGTHTITATYNGSTSFIGSSVSLTQTVN